MDPYRRLRKREIYRNPWLGVEVHDIVHPTGTPGEHVLIVSPEASAVLVEEEGSFIFAAQPRFGARRSVVEVVKGGAEPGETPLECAQRELREELGLTAERWESLGIVYEIPSIVSDPVTVFVASDLQRVDAEPEEIERITLVRMGVGDAFAAVNDGAIDDAVTLAALLRYALRRNGAAFTRTN
jgi:8-oxo-dGTP pyrophosphatase MutT (NUDIX family)